MSALNSAKIGIQNDAWHPNAPRGSSSNAHLKCSEGLQNTWYMIYTKAYNVSLYNLVAPTAG